MSRGRVIFSTLVASLGGLLFGFDTAVISGTTEALQKVYTLDNFWLGFTVASALIGTIVGAFSVGKPAHVFGRKRVLFVLAVFYFLSAIGTAMAQNWILFLAARFLGGVAVGAASVVAPMYIAEISPAHLRGRLVAINQLNIVSGILLAYFSNYLIARFYVSDEAWRLMFGVMAIPSALFFILLFFIPFSPRWLAIRGRVDEARRSLEWLGHEDIDRELAEIVESVRGEVGVRKEKLFQRRYSFPIFLAFSLAMFNQLSGINALMYYAPRIFQMAGATGDVALLQAVAVGGTNLVFTILALFIIDRFGRKPLLLVGSVGTALSMLLVAVQFFTQAFPAGIVLAGLLSFIAFFALSQGAVIWVFLSEVFPNSVRAEGQALGSFTHWVMAAVVSWTFPVIAQASGGTPFAIFGVMMVVQLFFVWKIIPETRGLTLEELEHRIQWQARQTAP